MNHQGKVSVAHYIMATPINAIHTLVIKFFKRLLFLFNLILLYNKCHCHLHLSSSCVFIAGLVPLTAYALDMFLLKLLGFLGLVVMCIG